MSETRKPPPLGPERTWDQRCGYAPGLDFDNPCLERAVAHIMWDSSCENSIACETHRRIGLEQFSWIDWHPICPVCAMPGSTWHFDEKRCVIEGLDDSIPELDDALPLPGSMVLVTPDG